MSAALLKSAQLTAQFGAYIQPGIGFAYPELVQLLLNLYRNRVSKLSFVPSDWLENIEAAMSNDVVVKLQQSLPNGQKFMGLPSWITADSRSMLAWQEVADLVDDAVAAFAAQRVEAGRSIIASADANAAFWNGLYKTAVVIRDLPGNAVGAVGDGVLSFLKSFFKRTWYFFALAVVCIIVWVYRGELFKAIK